MSAKITNVVVFGPGALGLGLIGFLAGEAGFKLTLVDRLGSHNRPDFTKRRLHSRDFYRVTALDGRHTDVIVASAVFRDRTRAWERLVADLAQSEEDLIICTTLASGQASSMPYIRTLIDARLTGGTKGFTLIIPCENNVSPALAALADEVSGKRRVAYADAMVDRFCSKPSVLQSPSVVNVDVGTELEWAVAIRPNRAASQRDLARVRSALESMQVTVVPDVAVVKERKTLMCNGVHFCMALLAKGDTKDRLQDFLATPEGTDALASLTFEFATVWKFRKPAESADYIKFMRAWYHKRLAVNDHTVAEVLRNLSANNPSGFGRDILNKLEDAYADLRKADGELARDCRMLEALKTALKEHSDMYSNIE